jgi:methionyl aminopeptidase
MIKVKSEWEVEVIRGICAILVDILKRLKAASKPGVTTAQLNRLAERLMSSKGVQPAFPDYGFPGFICTSINEEVVHGIPGARVLKEGDILSIDIGIKKDSFYADMATTVGIGKISKRAQMIIDTAKGALLRGIGAAREGARVSDISYAIGSFVEERGYFVVKRFVGHGIGRQMWEEPQIPNWGLPGVGAKLRVGMVLALEPMVKEDKGEVKIAENGWTAKSKGLSAHFEEMVLVGKDGPQILTGGV